MKETETVNKPSITDADLGERIREWIHKPESRGAPLNRVQQYFREKLAKFREEHQQFDYFLLRINELIEEENNPDFNNIVKFINGEAKANWICANSSIFKMLVMLFNLCLSPKQAIEYIKECLVLYKEMLKASYEIAWKPTFFVHRSSWDGQYIKFIRFVVIPMNKQQYCFFSITTPLRIRREDLECLSLSSDIEIDIDCGDVKLKHALMLFEYYQEEELLKKLFQTGIQDLIEKGIIKSVGQKDDSETIFDLYDEQMEE